MRAFPGSSNHLRNEFHWAQGVEIYRLLHRHPTRAFGERLRVEHRIDTVRADSAYPVSSCKPGWKKCRSSTVSVRIRGTTLSRARRFWGERAALDLEFHKPTTALLMNVMKNSSHGGSVLANTPRAAAELYGEDKSHETAQPGAAAGSCIRLGHPARRFVWRYAAQSGPGDLPVENCRAVISFDDEPIAAGGISADS